MYRAIGLGVLLSLGGCMAVSDMVEATREQFADVGLLDHSQTQRGASRRLQADSFIYIAQDDYPASPDAVRSNALADEAYRSFTEYFPQVRRAEAPLSLQQALVRAQSAGAHYLLFGRVAGEDDRIGTLIEWEDQQSLDRLGVDRGVVQLLLIETATRFPVDAARITTRGGLLTLYETRPQDLLGAPLRQYARSLRGLN
ncbi:MULTISPECIES: DUF4823 domain-containing protein [Pseudomonas]|uniref:Lipoprotein n=1 Tax=Pseudomonas flexibilis TaxID=706570 RepID=A0A0B3C091_9PSED|nr:MULTISPECIES: DUF4823 domain-containing protein [Pseudomonas]KHO66359.1 lipoprotein [Pseudomonas flexibilis]SCY49279.1 protein of unknown function [Pseudomonas flexibilis]